MAFLRLVLIGSVGAMLSFAESWSGFLVDSECYISEHKDTKAGTHPASIDNGKIVQLCSPKKDTKTLAFVTRDGIRHDLDPDGAQKARDLISKHPEMSRYSVNVSGDMNQNTITVANISLSK